MRARLDRREAECLLLVEESLGGVGWKSRILEEGPLGQVVFEFSNQARRVVAKAYEGDAGRQNDRALRVLQREDFRWLRVPTPILYDSPTRVLLTEYASGRNLDGLDLAENQKGLWRIGAALRELHECAADFGPTKRLVDHVNELIHPSIERLVCEFPDATRSAEQFFDAIQAAAANSDRIPCVPLHRDFHLRQLFDDGDTISVVDWDLAAMGDPAFDVAYFKSYLSNHYPTAIAEPAIRSFLRGYRPVREVLERVNLYESFNYFRRSCRRLRLRDEGWQEEIARMLMQLDRNLSLVSLP